MSERSIRERIEDISLAMQGDPPPSEIRGYEVRLAGMLWEVSKACTVAEIAFRKAVPEAPGDSAAAREQNAKASDSYGIWRMAETEAESCKQMLVTCRSALRSVSDEMRMQR